MSGADGALVSPAEKKALHDIKAVLDDNASWQHWTLTNCVPFLYTKKLIKDPFGVIYAHGKSPGFLLEWSP